jgi:hypothetical protein
MAAMLIKGAEVAAQIREELYSSGRTRPRRYTSAVKKRPVKSWASTRSGTTYLKRPRRKSSSP